MIFKKPLLRALVSILPFYNMAGWAMDADIKVDFDDVNDGTNRSSQAKSYSGQHKTTQTVRIWLELPVPADRFKSWMHGDSGKEKWRRK